MLANKSLTELRGIAQSFGVSDIFQKDTLQLIQAIEAKQKTMSPAPVVSIPRPEYDARLMTKPPGKITNRQEIEELLKPYVARGLHIKYDEERWYMTIGKKNDQGTLRMPLRVVLKCAEELMR